MFYLTNTYTINTDKINKCSDWLSFMESNHFAMKELFKNEAKRSKVTCMYNFLLLLCQNLSKLSIFHLNFATSLYSCLPWISFNQRNKCNNKLLYVESSVCVFVCLSVCARACAFHFRTQISKCIRQAINFLLSSNCNVSYIE